MVFPNVFMAKDPGSLVSVIIPTHDRWPMLGEAVESVLVQTADNFELIVVDDGSTDDTACRLRDYGVRLTVLTQSRRGVAAARNHGASRASGGYLAFLDSDDLWHPHKLERQLSFMERHPEVEICQTDEIWIRNGVRVNPRNKHRKPSGDIFRASLDLCLVSPSAVMMRRDLFERVGGFDESLPVCEDYDLWLRIARDTEIPLIPEALVTKRGGHADQLSRSTWGFDRFRVTSIANLIESGLDAEKTGWALEALAKKVTILAKGFRKRGNEAMARDYEERLRRVSALQNK
ncbi:MAG: glycosyltransferase family A protein [Deltaproteobacteria bacterium]|nr:glycosyltransferase family A protein [Deltaproteobacteria bacterium]